MHQILNTQNEFYTVVKQQRRSFLVKELNLLTKNSNELKVTLSGLLSYCLVEWQIDKIDKEFKLFEESSSLMISTMSEHLTQTFKYGSTQTDLLAIKKTLHYLSYICQRHGLGNLEAAYLDICSALAIIYSGKIEQELRTKTEQWMTSTPIESLSVKTLAEYQENVERYGFAINGMNSELFRLLDRPFTPLQAPFSNFLLMLIGTLKAYIQSMVQFLRGIYDFDGKIFTRLQAFIEKLNDSILKACKDTLYDPITLAHLSSDLSKLPTLHPYLLSFISLQARCTFSFDLGLGGLFANTRAAIDDRIHTDYPVSLGFHLGQYAAWKWMEKKPLGGPRVFVEELGYFLQNTLSRIIEVNYPVGVSLAYMTYREINRTLCDLLLNKVKEFNIVDLSILNTEIKYLCKIAEEDFFELDRTLPLT